MRKSDPDIRTQAQRRSSPVFTQVHPSNPPQTKLNKGGKVQELVQVKQPKLPDPIRGSGYDRGVPKLLHECLDDYKPPMARLRWKYTISEVRMEVVYDTAIASRKLMSESSAFLGGPLTSPVIAETPQAYFKLLLYCHVLDVARGVEQPGERTSTFSPAEVEGVSIVVLNLRKRKLSEDEVRFQLGGGEMPLDSDKSLGNMVEKLSEIQGKAVNGRAEVVIVTCGVDGLSVNTETYRPFVENPKRITSLS